MEAVRIGTLILPQYTTFNDNKEHNGRLICKSKKQLSSGYIKTNFSADLTFAGTLIL